jgi:putative membrane protein
MTTPDGPADPRTYFAAERTFLAWIRTGLALMGFGFVVARFGLFLRQITALQGKTVVAHPTFSLWAGTGLVLLGVVVNALSAIRYGRLLRQLSRGESPRLGSSPLATIISILLAAIGLATAIYLIVSYKPST